MDLRDVSSTRVYFDVSFFEVRRLCKLKDEKKKCGLYMRVSTEDQARERF